MEARSWMWVHSPLFVLTGAQDTLQCPILHMFLVVVTRVTLNPEYSIPNVQTVPGGWAEGLGFTPAFHIPHFIPAGCGYPSVFCLPVSDPDQWLVITWIWTVLAFLLFFAKICNIYLPISGLKSRKHPPEVRKCFFNEKRWFHSSWQVPFNHIIKSKGLQKWTSTTKFHPGLLCIPHIHGLTVDCRGNSISAFYATKLPSCCFLEKYWEWG